MLIKVALIAALSLSAAKPAKALTNGDPRKECPSGRDCAEKKVDEARKGK